MNPLNILTEKRVRAAMRDLLSLNFTSRLFVCKNAVLYAATPTSLQKAFLS